MTTTKPWVDGLTFSAVLAQTTKHFPDNDAVVFPQLDLRWSYEEFSQRVKETAKAFVALGVKKGDHVGIWATNWPEWILTQFATAQIGAVLVNVNPAYRADEVAYVLNQADIKTLVITDTHKTSNYEEMVAGLVPEVKTCPLSQQYENVDFPKLRHVISIKENPQYDGVWRWSTFLQQAERVRDSEIDACCGDVTAEMPVNIQYTSGTTGDPKGAMLSHRNLLMNAFYTGERQNFTDQDRVCIPVPFYHCFGCVIGTLASVVYGATMVVPAESFEPVATLDAIEKERCTAIYGVPTMFSAEVHDPSFEGRDVSSLRTGAMGGSPCPVELMKKITTDMHLPEITIAFGQTEASPVITQSKTSDPLDVRVSTVGTPIPGTEVRIVDPETNREVAQGEQGELCARGHGVMLGYYKMPDATAAAIDEDGWLHTGDLATQCEDGNYRITGRIKDLIIRGGENVYPREIEEYLLTHPGIREVQVVGLPDEKFGEQVSAWIARSDVTLTEDAVRAFCKDKIAHYKIPHYVAFVDEYPLTVTGKVQKYRLREMGVEMYGLDAAAHIETA